MAETQYVIVGGGLAAVSAIEGIRELDKTGPITLVTAERELPYHRPPLSKTFLAGKDGVETVRVHEAAWYPENKVRVRLNQLARSVHISRQSVALESGERVEYDKLLVATGCAAKRLNAPGVDTPGVMYLRTLQDCYALRAAIKPDLNVVTVGGGFVGMEVAATARHLGAQVTVVEVGPSLYRAFSSPELSAFFQRVLESQGITVRTGTRVSRFRAEDGRLAAVVADDGEQIPADVAVVGVGAEPNTEWLASSGFSIDRGGLIVNLRLETPGKDVWAAGDIARFPDPVTRQPRRLEHWGNALAQGKQAGRNMAGAGEPYLHQSAFFSDIFDITINVLGDTENPDSVEVRGEMDLAAPHFTALYVKGTRLAGAVTVNLNTADRAQEFDDLQRSIREGTIPPT
jgi:3-phenylpropionate/trans-cinnamate dioxygenase ferredoxin reductase subunit